MSKKIITSLLVLILIISNCNFISDAKGIEEQATTGTFTHSNPLYDDGSIEVKEQEQYNKTAELNEENSAVLVADIPTFSDIDTATLYWREAMVERKQQFSFCYSDKTLKPTEIHTKIKQNLFIETNNPKEGDYLNWHYLNWDGEFEVISTGTVFTVQVNYVSTAKQEEYVDNEVQRLLTTGELKGLYSKTDFDKIKAVYSYITDEISYSTTNDKFSCYNALVEKSAVCQGVSTSIYRLLRELGVSTRVIVNTTTIHHGWNIVKINNMYYNMDATWDLKTGGSFSYFLKGSNNFDVSHPKDSAYKTSEFVSKYPISLNDYNSNNAISKVGISYKSHVQTFGWEEQWRSDKETSGTSGLSKRLEGIQIKLTNTNNLDLGVRYKTHVQTYGWLPWSTNGETSGTTGESKRLEAIAVELTGKEAINYDVYYRVHAETFGWLGWTKNGENAGTAGLAKRLEAIEICILPKGQVPKGLVGYSYIGYGMANTGNGSDGQVTYSTHIQSYGWQNNVSDGSISGSFGLGKRLEGITINLGSNNSQGGIRYKTHVQTYGWQDWVLDGTISGTVGQSKRLEAVSIELYGEVAAKYDVYYRVHVESYGWLGWVKNGEIAGTEGQAKRLEAIQVILIPKNSDNGQNFLYY